MLVESESLAMVSSGHSKGFALRSASSGCWKCLKSTPEVIVALVLVLVLVQVLVLVLVLSVF